MKSGLDDISQPVNDLETGGKLEQKVSNDRDFIPKDYQVEPENYKHLTDNIKKDSKNDKLLTPCLKTRNSFEDFIQTNDTNKKNNQYKSFLKNKSQNSDSNLVKPTGLSKILTWDPWHKIGRKKGKKDKRKNEETKEKMTVVADQQTGDGPQSINQEKKTEIPQGPSNFEMEISEVVESEINEDSLNPRPAKVRKIVRFHADVKVVHYFDDEILGHTIEPLKKELEQQERNKELRKEFSPEMGVGLKQSLKKCASDYMAAWYKK